MEALRRFPRPNKKPREQSRGFLIYGVRRPQASNHQRFKLDRVGRKGTDAFGELLGGHGVLVQRVAEPRLVVPHRRNVQAFGGLGIKRTRQRRLARRQLGQQLGTDGEQVAARERGDLAHVAEARTHHLGGDAMALVELEDPPHGTHARIIGLGVGGLVPLSAGLLLVPVVDAAHEGGDEAHAGLAAGHGLGKGEQQGEVAVDALALQLLGRADALPRGRDLDQDSVAVHALGPVQRDQPARARQRGLCVEAQARIDLSGHAPGDELQDLDPEAHQQSVHQLHLVGHPMLRDGLGQQRRVLGLLHRFQDERGIGGGILGGVGRQLLEVAGVGDHGGELFEGVELVHCWIIASGGNKISVLRTTG